MASATAVTASSWPTMQRCSSSSRCSTCACVRVCVQKVPLHEHLPWRGLTQCS
jgi:hypothetical protein